MGRNELNGNSFFDFIFVAVLENLVGWLSYLHLEVGAVRRRGVRRGAQGCA